MEGMKKLVIIFLLLSSTTCWALPECRGNNVAAWHNCFGEATYKNSGRWVGEYRNGVMHGHGTYYYNFGEFKGDVFIGNVEYNIRTGQGTYTYRDGRKYIGQWKNDLNHGRGIWYWTNGDRYDGNFVAGRKYGFGIYTFSDGGQYSGQWKDDLMHGEGIEVSADRQQKLEGVWEYGVYKYAKKIMPKNSTPEYTPPANEVPESEPFKEDLYDDKEILIAGNGTGFAVTKSGHVITNYHVSNFCDDIYSLSRKSDPGYCCV